MIVVLVWQRSYSKVCSKNFEHIKVLRQWCWGTMLTEAMCSTTTATTTASVVLLLLPLLRLLPMWKKTAERRLPSNYPEGSCKSIIFCRASGVRHEIHVSGLMSIEPIAFTLADRIFPCCWHGSKTGFGITSNGNSL